MKTDAKLLRLALVASAVACALVLPPPRRSSARQDDARGLTAVRVRVEDGKELKLYERSYALVVGVSDYAQWPKLPGVRRDVEEVARALERHGFLVTKVENPDSAQLDKSFREFIDAHGRGVENRLLFYFAGHGHTVKQSYGEEMGYIVPADAPLPARDAAGFMSKAMDMQQMELYARRVQSKHALFLFDSCFSGAIFALSRAVPDAITYKTARPVRQFITSGSADEQVPDQSIFRRQFVEALDGEADANHDGYVTGTELGEFLQDKVVNYSRGTQHPQYGKIRNPNLDKGDFVFALPKGAKPQPPAAAAAAPTPAPPRPAPVDPAALELAFWDSVKESKDPEDFKEYLDKYPAGRFAGIARRRLSALTSDSSGELPFLYRPPEGRYEILLPGPPTLKEQVVTAANGEKLTVYVSSVEEGDTTYIISYNDYPASLRYVPDTVREAVLKQARGQLLMESVISLGHIPGREWRIAGYGDNEAELHTRARWYNSPGRTYLVEIITPRAAAGAAYTAKAAKFFDSFVIIPKP